jgi:hypothetical protein
MNKQNDLEISNPQTPIEDLPVNQDQATEVNGGAWGTQWGSSMYQYAHNDPNISH